MGWELGTTLFYTRPGASSGVESADFGWVGRVADVEDFQVVAGGARDHVGVVASHGDVVFRYETVTVSPADTSPRRNDIDGEPTNPATNVSTGR